MENKKTILAVDDSEDNLKVIERPLIKEGYNVILCSKSRDSLEIMKNNTVDLILLDWMMPEVSGLEICKIIKDDKKLKYTPVIMVTARTEIEDLREGLNAGADDYIRKPVDKMELIARVRAALRAGSLQKDLNYANIKLTEAHRMASIGTMAAGVAHEINNPLNIASGYIHIVRRDLTDLVEIVKRYSKITLPPEKSEEIENFKKEIDLPYLLDNFDDKPSRCEGALRRIQDIVKNLGDFAHLDKKEIAAININTSIESALKVIPEKQKQNIEVETEFAQLPSISCCGREINQVFMNVIINALQMMKSEGTLKIKTLLEDSKYAVIIISDTGPGIPVDKIKYIFDPFYTTKPVGEGTGLGLATCYSIMEKHGGSITAVNNPAKGATFTIKLLTKGIKNEPR